MKTKVSDAPLPENSQARDPLFPVLLLAIGAVTAWLLLTPWVPAVAQATMKRFHLRSRSFAAWALQAPIPAMYNFANQYEVRELPEDLIVSFLEPESNRRYINHFPLRVLTFADGRYRHLRPGKDRWVTVWTRYRGQQIKTVIHAKPVGGGGFEWIVQEAD
ncbi:hypothetical protein FYK55_09160 [Roseiconus nitratireducens]|uniref:Uncharacterized protein n=1 Tax=Roseiconus nitratireducens TaxID=2605748 RepID=A0A5M6DAA5_9BACT|nr:hypothetical protein [Roseiconus nitratireducens]KAA5544488.1 hypothetical protein FYK55_09160 [Roseiconus nitratireducens]